jgi:hypothetical protein
MMSIRLLSPRLFTKSEYAFPKMCTPRDEAASPTPCPEAVEDQDRSFRYVRTRRTFHNTNKGFSGFRFRR